MEETQKEDASDKKEERRQMSTWSENGPSKEAPTGDTEGGRRQREWGRKSGEAWGVQKMETGRVGTEEKWESNREEERHVLTCPHPGAVLPMTATWELKRSEKGRYTRGGWGAGEDQAHLILQGAGTEKGKCKKAEASGAIKQSQTPVLLGICAYSAQDGAATQRGIP